MSRTDLKAAILNPLKSATMSGMKAHRANATKMPLSILVIAEDTGTIEGYNISCIYVTFTRDFI